MNFQGYGIKRLPTIALILNFSLSIWHDHAIAKGRILETKAMKINYHLGISVQI